MLTHPLQGGQTLELQLFDIKDFKIIQENKYTKIFDYDKMVGTLIFRTRLSGDFFCFGTDKKKKKLKEYMIDEKISKELRAELPVIALGSHIVWLIGYVKTTEFEVEQHTKHILQISINEGQPTCAEGLEGLQH